MASTRRETLSFTIDGEKKAKIAAIANRHGMTTSVYVRNIVEQHIKGKYYPKHYRKKEEIE